MVALLLALLPLVPGPRLEPAAHDASARVGVACPAAGTPPATAALAAPAVAASPVPDAKAGTPVARAGLSVALLTETTKARPNDLTVIVLDEACAPVTDATVTIRTRSLAMDHGVRTSEALPAGPGRYVADQVPMGMAGDWQAEVSVARLGRAAVVFVFIVTLQGPS